MKCKKCGGEMIPIKFSRNTRVCANKECENYDIPRRPYEDY